MQVEGVCSLGVGLDADVLPRGPLIEIVPHYALFFTTPRGAIPERGVEHRVGTVGVENDELICGSACREFLIACQTVSECGDEILLGRNHIPRGRTRRAAGVDGGEGDDVDERDTREDRREGQDVLDLQSHALVFGLMGGWVAVFVLWGREEGTQRWQRAREGAEKKVGEEEERGKEKRSEWGKEVGALTPALSQQTGRGWKRRPDCAEDGESGHSLDQVCQCGADVVFVGGIDGE